MNDNKCFRFAFLFVAVFGLVLLDGGPLVGVAKAQRSNRDDEVGDRGRGGFRGGAGRGGFGGEGGRGGRRFGGEGGGVGGGDGGGRRRPQRDDDEVGNNQRSSRREEGNNERSRDRDNDSGPSTAEYARQFVRTNDKNGNMMLEGDELRGLREPQASADANNDKVITVEEIVAKLANRGDGSASTRSAGSRRGTSQNSSAAGSAAKTEASRVYLGAVGSSTAADKNATSKRRTYRFTPAAERLPAGLPSWFKSRDRDNDGQVAMSEYSRTWSERMVNEFRRFDLNNDGVVTAKEAAK